MADILVTSPFQPFTLPTQFKAVFNGYIYCGTVDAVDPSVSQVQVYLVNEAGDRVPVAQPLRTNAGGYLVYNGQPSKFVTDSNHSLLVKDSLQTQVWYEPDMAMIDPETAFSELKSMMVFDGTVADISDGKFTVGNSIRVRDRDGGVFLVVAGGIPNGIDIIDAGGGNTAVADKTSNILAYGGSVAAPDNTAVISHMLDKEPAGFIKIPKGVFKGSYIASKQFSLGLVGDGIMHTTLLAQGGSDGVLLPTGKQLRGQIRDINIAAANTLTGTGIKAAAGFMVNADVSNVTINGFDVGMDLQVTNFSNVFSNVRVNGARRSFNLTSTGQSINQVFDGLYSSQPTELGMFMANAKNWVFNAYNSGSSGHPHLDIAGNSIGIIFNVPNFEQDAGILPAGSQCVTVQGGSQITFNQPTFAAPKSVDNTTYLFRVKNTAVVYIDRPTIIGADANIKHIFAENDSVVYLNDPLGVIDFSKVSLFGNARIVRLDRVSNNGWTASGKVASHAAGAPLITGLSTVPVAWHVEIDKTAIGDAVLDVVAQVTQLGTGTLKIRYITMSTGAESFTARPLVWMAR